MAVLLVQVTYAKLCENLGLIVKNYLNMTGFGIFSIYNAFCEQELEAKK